MLKPWHLACVLTLSSTAAISGPLQLLSDERAVSSGGAASTTTDRTYYDGTPYTPVVVEDNKPSVMVTHPSNSFGLFNKSEGMSLSTPSATVDGQGYQVSNITSNGFNFHGVADVFASTNYGVDYQQDYTEINQGNASGNAGVALTWTFAINTATQMAFTGSHNLYSASGGGGSYALTGNNGFAWDDEGYSSFSTVLTLAPGTYTFNVSLYAFAYASYNDSRGGRANADFALTAVPEPETYALLLSGMLLVASVARRRQRQI
jgi:PEP-CTERM motif